MINPAPEVGEKTSEVNEKAANGHTDVRQGDATAYQPSGASRTTRALSWLRQETDLLTKSMPSITWGQLQANEQDGKDTGARGYTIMVR